MMKRHLRSVVVTAGLALGLVGGVAGVSVARAQSYAMFPNDALPMIQRSVLDRAVEGKLGDIGYDPISQCRYFAGTRSNRIEVLDPQAMNTLQSVTGVNEPIGIAVAPDLRKVIVSCGDGSVRVYDIATDGKLTEKKAIQFSGEADQIRYDLKSKKAFVTHGKTLDWVKPEDGSKSDKGLELPAQARGMVVDPGSSKLYVAIPSKSQVVVIDRDKWAIDSTWDLKDAQPGPLAIDEQAGRLFVASRTPAKLLVVDTKTGKESADRLEIGEDAGGCWWDPVGQRVYVSAGGNQGQISMLWLKDGKFTAEHQIDTAPGARSSVFIPEKRQYVVTAPMIGGTGYPPFVYIYVLPTANEHHNAAPKHE